MIFEGLSDKLQGALGKLKSKGKLTEKDVKDAMREVKLALLEADVNFKVVKDFVKKVQERCVGQEVMSSLTPGQHVIKIVNEELTSLMGDVSSKIMISPKPPAPTKVPIAVIPIAKTNAFRKPAMITDNESGNSTIRSNCQRVIPIPLPESRMLALTFCIPVYVFLIIGSKAYKKTVTITVLTPKPSPIMIIDSIANDGIV